MPWAIFGVFLVWAYFDFRKYAQPLDDSSPILLNQKLVSPHSKFLWSDFRFKGYIFAVQHYTGDWEIQEIWRRRVGFGFWKQFQSKRHPEFAVFTEIARGAWKTPQSNNELKLINDLFHPSQVPDRALSRAESIADQEKGLSRLTGDEGSPESVST